ncbi:PRC-barrel domain containing protein [Streptomyces sp. SCUT-3]|uniref:PRC-barrel domain-containing protein n=1 Tax=Streptomyces sp. SCUT-3 TaxID=2684469 RepID=UPI000CA8CF73|nr:PRC-barrel domain-containing protein [Streptomyces sp. SCUT-3]PLW72296.1 photosystem reaction center subunit H [Streptomyces sp. DJ]QMV20763.1 PRC-barrel domain containing protein [Streptomyces sp. SCUT-3]
MQTDIDPRSLIGRKAYDRNGARLGVVDEVYLDDATGEPDWAAVRTGLFSRDVLVPLEPSELVGEELRVPFEKALVKSAPDYGVGRHLSPEQEMELYRHYGIDVMGAEPPSAPDRDFGTLAGNPRTAGSEAAGAGAPAPEPPRPEAAPGPETPRSDHI